MFTILGGTMRRFMAIERFIQQEKQNPHNFINWSEQQPEYADDVKQARSEKGELRLRKPFIERAVYAVKHLVWLDSSDLHGRSYVDKKLISDAKGTATIISSANLINIITTLPFLALSFAGMDWLTWFLTGTTGSLILVASNRLGLDAVSAKKRESPGARASLIGFALLNLILSLTAGPGTELLLNQPALAEERARELIEQQVLGTQRLEEGHIATQEQEAQILKTECEDIQRKYEELPVGDLKRDELYIRANGTWSDRNRDWSQVPIADLPICRRADYLLYNVAQQRRRFETGQVAIKDRLDELGAIAFLKEERADIYVVHFDGQGIPRSGVEMSRIAIENFLLRFVKGEWTAIGFSLFFFALSLATSGTSVWKVATFSNRRDVALSYDSTISQMREELFHVVEQGLRRIVSTPINLQSEALTSLSSGNINSQQAYQLRLLGLCAERIRQSGECRYPPFLELIQGYTTAGGTHWKRNPDMKLAYHSWRIITLYKNIVIAARQAQDLMSAGSKPVSSQQLQALIQTATKGSQALLMQIDEVKLLLDSLHDIVSPLSPSELNSARTTLSFACEYLLHREAEGSLLSSLKTKNRCYRYLSDLQEVAHEISQTLLEKIAKAGVALGIFNR